MTHTDTQAPTAVMEAVAEHPPHLAVGTADAAPLGTGPAPQPLPEPALLDNVARHLRLHPQAQVRDDRGRLRNLTRQEAEEIARVAMRAAQAWLRPADGGAGTH